MHAYQLSLIDTIDCFPPSELATRKVGANCHIAFNGVNYSVPHTLYKQTVIVRATNSVVDILNSSGECVASHIRCYSKRRYITDPSHMPPYYLSLSDDLSCFDGAKLRRWAKDIGSHTYNAVDILLQKRAVEEQSYKSCLAILSLSKKYGSAFLEISCKKACESDTVSYSAICKIIRALH